MPLFLLILGLVGCSGSANKSYAYDLDKFEPDILEFDSSKSEDIRDIAATLRVYEIAPSERRRFIARNAVIHEDGQSLSIEGDGAQVSISVERVNVNPLRIRVVVGTPTDETMTIYVLERTDGGWNRASRKFLN